jgi:hypothetical protein
MKDLSICDALIAAHEASPNKRQGAVYNSGDAEGVIDKSVKDAEESLIDDAALAAYAVELKAAADQYIARYPQCNMYSSWGVVQAPHIQKYNPGGGFFKWHCERAQATPALNSTRHLVFMTYLNDVTDGGETEFQLQELKVQPKKGLTLIWPADWTHTHRGNPSPTQTKYIITGWFNFV